MKDFNGKIIVITGVGSGIGRSLVHLLLSKGAVVVGIDKDADGMIKTVETIPDPKKIKTFQADISDKTQVQSVANKIIDKFGTIDILINNAGVSSSGSVLELTMETFEWTININLWGTVYMTKAFLPFLAKRPEAAIVNVSSVYGLIGVQGQAAYCTSKFAVRGFTEALRQEFFGTNLQVITVYPGGVKTNIAKNSKTDHVLTTEVYKKKLIEFESTLKTSPQTAAECILDGIIKKKTRVLIGKDANNIDFLSRLIPGGYDKYIINAMQKLYRQD